jgi:hypothetical protein
MPKLLDDYLSEEETAAQLDVTARTLRNWRRGRTGPPVTLFGRKVMYFKPSIVAWLRSRERKAAA